MASTWASSPPSRHVRSPSQPEAMSSPAVEPKATGKSGSQRSPARFRSTSSASTACRRRRADWREGASVGVPESRVVSSSIWPSRSRTSTGSRPEATATFKCFSAAKLSARAQFLDTGRFDDERGHVRFAQAALQKRQNFLLAGGDAAVAARRAAGHSGQKFARQVVGWCRIWERLRFSPPRCHSCRSRRSASPPPGLPSEADSPDDACRCAGEDGPTFFLP